MSNVDKTIRDTLLSISADTALGTDLLFATINISGTDQSVILFPSIYELVQVKANVDDELSANYVTVDGVREVLLGIYRPDDYGTSAYSEQDINTFLDTVNNNYFISTYQYQQSDVGSLKPDGTTVTSDIGTYKYRFTSSEIFGNGDAGFTTIRNKLNENSIDFTTMFNSNEINNNLRSILNDDAFAYAFNLKLQDANISSIQNKQIISAGLVRVGETTNINFKAIIRAEIAATEGGTYNNLLPSQIYIIISAPFNYTDSNAIVIQINELDDDSRSDLFKIVNNLNNSSTPMDFDNIKSQVDTTISNLTSNLNNQSSELSISYKDGTMTTDGMSQNIVFPSIYDYLTKIMALGDIDPVTAGVQEADPDVVRTTFKSINTYDHEEINPYSSADQFDGTSQYTITDRNLAYYFNDNIEQAFDNALEVNAGVNEVSILADDGMPNAFSLASGIASSWGISSFTTNYLTMVCNIQINMTSLDTHPATTLISKFTQKPLCIKSLTDMSSALPTRLKFNSMNAAETQIVYAILNKFQNGTTNTYDEATMGSKIDQYINQYVAPYEMYGDYFDRATEDHDIMLDPSKYIGFIELSII
jgi:hypothetical protein